MHKSTRAAITGAFAIAPTIGLAWHRTACRRVFNAHLAQTSVEPDRATDSDRSCRGHWNPTGCRRARRRLHSRQMLKEEHMMNTKLLLALAVCALLGAGYAVHLVTPMPEEQTSRAGSRIGGQ